MFAKALLLGAVAALAAAQSQVLTFTHVPNPVTDGEAQAITYATNDTSSPVEIILRKGQSGDLQTVMTLTKDATGGQYIWTPPKSLPNANDYALQIKQGNQVNYYGPFIVQGAIAASVSASASSTKSGNSTMTSTMTGNSTASMGTSTTMHRNTTMPHHTQTSKKTQTVAKTTAKTTATMTTTSGAGFQATSQTAAASATTTGGASPDFTSSSSFALVFGALAAILYLH